MAFLPLPVYHGLRTKPMSGGDAVRLIRWLTQERCRPLAIPSLFFLAVIYYEEIFLKLFCFQSLSLQGALFTFLFSIPIALILGLLCAAVPPRWGRILLPLCTGVISLWIGAQIVYYHLFKVFLTLFSITKMVMVAKSFGGMAGNEMLVNWFPILMMIIPFVLSILLRRRLIAPVPSSLPRLRWAALAASVELITLAIVLLCGGGTLSPRYLYTRAAAPIREAQTFGMLTQTHLEVRRVLFGIQPDDPSLRHLTKWRRPISERPQMETPLTEDQYSPEDYHIMDIDFDALMADEDDENLLAAHRWFSRRQPTAKNEWTGYFKGKNLIWIVAEAFSTSVLDPQRTPALWKMSREGFVCDNFYTPLWGVSTSDGEYVTTTGLIPKSGIWSYSRSSENYMPFALGTQFRKQGYTTMAFHDYLYNYYDRDRSHPNMGYDYYALEQGLELSSASEFPASDEEMMEATVPRFVHEDHFMVYYLTVSGHLNYNLEENAMSRRHWDLVKDLPYSDGVKCYLACQQELELAMESLLSQLEEAGKLEDTVIVLSADHYPYGLTDEEYSELIGHPVDPVYEIYRNTLLLWSPTMETPVHISKSCSSLDIMPTLSNLFDLEYDSRLIMGQDILSPERGMIIFSDYSFFCSKGRYNSGEDLFTTWDGSLMPEDEAAALMAEVQNRVAFSAFILDNDYYRLVLNGPPREDDSILSALLQNPPWNREDRPENGRNP